MQFQALQHAQTATAVRTALVATSSGWALLAAGVTAAVALVIAVAPGSRGPRIPARDRSGGRVARPIVGKLRAVVNHQHLAAGSPATGKIVFPEPGEAASALSK